MKDSLNEVEVEKIEAFVKDKVLFEAVRKVLLDSIYSQGVMKKGEAHNPFKNRAFALIAENTDNDQLGKNIKAWFEGVNALEAGYKELESIKVEKEEILSPLNEAI